VADNGDASPMWLGIKGSLIPCRKGKIVHYIDIRVWSTCIKEAGAGPP
jgi:hypothetical protein